MATARETIQVALRKCGVLPALQAPSAVQATMALTELNQLIAQYVGYGWSHPFVTVRQDVSVEMDDDSPSVRFALQNGSAVTITLPKNPPDGSRLQVIDPNNGLALNNVTLARNGWQIEGAASNLVLNTNGLNRTWMFRADTGNWTRAADLGLDDGLPFPGDFDAGIALLLATRIAGEYGVEMTRTNMALAKAAHLKLRARYVKPGKMTFDEGVLLLGSANHRWMFDYTDGDEP